MFFLSYYLKLRINYSMSIYYIKILFCFIIITLIIYSNPIKAELPLQGKVIVVDAGHGGLDPGTIYGNIYEKNINLSIAKYLEYELSTMGATVILTRNNDNDLSNGVKYHRKKTDFDNRIKIINEDYVDMYISIHLNYLSNSKYYGPQVFYNHNNKELAMIIQDELNKISTSNRSIKQIPSNTYMYDKLKKDGVLIECGFLSNSNDRNKLLTKDYQQILANTITKGIIKYLQ